MCKQQSLRSACAYPQSDQSLCLLLEFSLTVKLLTRHNLEFLRLKGGCTGSSESTLVKMPHCWKSHVTVQLANVRDFGTYRAYAQMPLMHAVQWRSKNAEKVSRIKGRLLDQVVILFNGVPFQNGNFS